MEKDWQALYFQLGALVSSLPADLAGPGAITPEMRLWMGRACALVLQVGNRADAALIMVSTDNLEGVMRASSANTIASIIYRSLAIAEASAPAAAQGSFIPVGRGFDAFSAISKVFAMATRQVLIVDPYMDEKALTVFAPLAAEHIQLHLLADETERKPSLLPAVGMWRNQFPTTRRVEVRLAQSKSLHDRLIVVDGMHVWTLTQSLNAFAARSPATIARLDAETAGLKAAAFTKIWDNSTPI